MAQRRVEYLRLSDIREAARNPKQHAEQELRASIDRFGLGDLPLLDDRTGRLVSGHGRIHDLAARRAAGQSPPDGVQVDGDGEWLAPVVMGWASRSDAEAEAYAVAANKLTEMGGWDEDALASLLTEMAEQDYDLALLTGFTAGQLEDLLAAAEPPPVVRDDVPATDARYAETPEQQEARNDLIGSYTPRQQSMPGYAELILVLSNDDRAEFDRLAGAARVKLGSAMRVSEVALRGLRVLTAVLDAAPTEPAAADFAKQAGWTPDETGE